MLPQFCHEGSDLEITALTLFQVPWPWAWSRLSIAAVMQLPALFFIPTAGAASCGGHSADPGAGARDGDAGSGT